LAKEMKKKKLFLFAYFFKGKKDAAQFRLNNETLLEEFS